MNWILWLKVCTALASNSIGGAPGECLATRWQTQDYETEAACLAAGNLAIRNGWQQYTYVGILFDKKVTYNVIQKATCVPA